MLARVTVLAFLVLIAAACGGGGTTSTQAPSSVAPTGAAPTSAPVGGDAIDAAAISAAVAALQARDSWQFDVSTLVAGPDGGYVTTVSGTERPPEQAVDAVHTQPDAQEFHYIRIGDDIWYDVGTGDFAHAQADDAENLIAQYEPYYLSSLAESAQSQRYLFELVGAETVSNIATNHYRLSQIDRENIVESLDDISADEWAGDVWIATDGGYLVGLDWGPQTPDKAQIPMGFTYLVTAVDCECPIEPPA